VRFLLDTNIVIDMLRNPESRALNHLEGLSIGDVGISTITLAELEYGVHRSNRPAHNAALLLQACSSLEICEFDSFASERYGRVRVQLESTGQPIGPLDTLIAAHALALGVDLVTHNTREFQRVDGLVLADWLSE
jgi:tRNA(fMet)-specific endonuclease VapC